MRYRLRNNYSTNPDKALKEILADRGVTDIENFMSPTSACELDPYKLVNIEKAAEEISKKYFGDGEMKSKSIGKNHQRRLRILTGLMIC